VPGAGGGRLVSSAMRGSTLWGMPRNRLLMPSGAQISSCTNLLKGRCLGSVRRTHYAMIQPKVYE
jgi:hypothetical protein